MQDKVRIFNILWKTEKIALAVISASESNRAHIIQCNTGWGALLEYGTGELRDESIIKLISQEDQLVWLTEFNKLIKGEIDKLIQVTRYVVRGNKHYVTCHTWGWRLMDASGHVASVLLHIRAIPEEESEAAKAEHEHMLARLDSMSHELQLVKGQLYAVQANNNHNHTDAPAQVTVSVGDRVGDNTSGSTRNDLGPFKWLIIGFIVLVIGAIWYEYYRSGGQEPPPQIPQIPTGQ